MLAWSTGDTSGSWLLARVATGEVNAMALIGQGLFRVGTGGTGEPQGPSGLGVLIPPWPSVQPWGYPSSPKMGREYPELFGTPKNGPRVAGATPKRDGRAQSRDGGGDGIGEGPFQKWGGVWNYWGEAVGLGQGLGLGRSMELGQGLQLGDGSQSRSCSR